MYLLFTRLGGFCGVRQVIDKVCEERAIHHYCIRGRVEGRISGGLQLYICTETASWQMPQLHGRCRSFMADAAASMYHIGGVTRYWDKDTVSNEQARLLPTVCMLQNTLTK